MSKVKGKFDVDTSITKPDLDISTPGLSVDINAPTTEIHVPTVDVDVPAAGQKVKGDGGRFKLPPMKMPSFGVSLPKFNRSEADVSVKKLDVDISLRKAEVDIPGLNIEARAPECEVDVEMPDVDLEGKGGKLKLPKFKGPKFGISPPDIKAPNIDINLPKIDISLPKSDVDMQVSGIDGKLGKMEGDVNVGDLELKGPDVSLKMPEVAKTSIDIGIPRIKGKFDVDTSITKPELDISTPGLSVDIKAPATEIHVPTADVDVPTADLKVKGDGGRFKMPSMKLPSFGVSLPKFQGPVVDVNVKKSDVDISFGKPAVDIQGPNIDVRAPECEVDVEKPDVDIEPGAGKMKLPKFKALKFGFLAPDIKAPKMTVDVSVPTVDISLPKSDVRVKVPGKHVKSGKVEGDFSLPPVDLEDPDASLQISEIRKSFIDTSIPKVKGRIDVDSSRYKHEHLTAPGLSVDLKDQSSDIHVPISDVDVDLADPNIKGDGGKIKMPLTEDAGPSLKIPETKVLLFSKFNFPDVDFGIEATGKDVSLSEGPTVAKAATKEAVHGKTGEDMNKTVPELKVQKAAELAVESSPSKGKTSWFKFPKISFSSPWKKEKGTDGEEQAVHEISTSSSGAATFGVKATDMKTDGVDILPKGPSDEVSPLIICTSKKVVVKGTENTAAEGDPTQMLTIKCKIPDTPTSGTHIIMPSQIVTSMARTELALLESGGFAMNAPVSKASKISSLESCHQGQVPTCESSSGLCRTALTETKISKTNERQQSIKKTGVLQGPDLSMSSRPEGSTHTHLTEYSTVVTKEYLIEEQAASGASEPVTYTKECSSFLSECHSPKSEYTVSSEGHTFTKKCTKTGGTVVLTESSFVQGDMAPEATVTDDTSAIFQRKREMIQSQQKLFSEISQPSSVSISITKSKTKEDKKTENKE
ncbi:hypothetical protein scyTo_0006813 [Scyliorhinus torazame]|uniref:AHNAK nucleoprotein n=1 Tax=Scyliorhinus torazame TaxID=75743 RepID=A0A401NGP1_SCYTO|nr:hypothetical protein [Scyliorhinus torazame]